MAEAAKLREHVKENLRATLLSVPGGLPLRGLLLDYKKMVGTELQFRQLGYTTADELLNTLPDVVQIYNVAGEKNYVGVPDASTKHIQKLVSRQKVSNSGYPRALKRYPSAPSRAAPRVVQLPSDASMQRAASSGRRPNIDLNAFRRMTSLNILKQTPTTNHTASAVVPPTVQMDIRDLLVAFPHGILMKQLNGAFQKMFNYNIDPEKYGFENITAMMSSMPEIVSLQNTGKELKVLPKKLPQSKNNSSSKVAASAIQLTQCQATQNKSAAVNPPILSVDTVVSHTRSASSPPALRHHPFPHEVNHNHVYEEEEEQPRSQEPMIEVGLKMKETIRKILAKHPEGINYLAFPAKFREETGLDFIYQDLGVYSIMAFMSAIPDIVTCYRPHPQQSWILYDARLRPKFNPLSKPSPVEEVKVVPLPEEFKRKLIKVLEQFHPHGVSMSSIPRQYRTMYNEDMNYAKYGYSSLELLLISLIDDVVKLNYFDEGVQVHLAKDAHLRYMEALPYDAYKSVATLPSSSSTTTTTTVPQPVKTNTSVDCPPGFIPPCHEIPADACLRDKSIGLQQLPSTWELRSYCRVIVSHVENPGQFWVQLHGEETSATLSQLMDDLETAYNMGPSLMEQYTIPPRYLQPGMICVAPYENDWHRAQIVSLPDEENVKVSYVDYGTVGDVSRTGLKFLKERFVKFPAQALEAKLANVIPLHSELHWSRDARNLFFTISTKSKLLVAMLMAKTVDRIKQTQVLSLCLTDMSDNNEVHINDLLVDKQLAEFAHMQDDASERPSVEPQSAALPTAAPTLNVPTIPQAKDQDVLLMQQACWNAVYGNPLFMYGSMMPSTLYPQVVQQQPSIYKQVGPPSNYTSSFPNVVPSQGLLPNPWSFGNMGVWPNALNSNSMTNQFSIPSQRSAVPSPATVNHQGMINPFSVTTTQAAGIPVSASHITSVPFSIVSTHSAATPVTKMKQTFNFAMPYPVAAPILKSDSVPSVPHANAALQPESLHRKGYEMFKEEKATSATLNGSTCATAKLPDTLMATVSRNSVAAAINLSKHDNCVSKGKVSSGEPDVNDIGSPVRDAFVPSGDAPRCQNGFSPNSKAQTSSSHTPDNDSVEDDFNNYLDDNAFIEKLCLELDSIPLVKKRNIKLVELTPEHKVHLVFYQKQLHMVGFEVSAFVWKKDVLRNMIMIHGIKVVSHIITEESDPELFAELLQYHLRNSEACTATLYPLSSVLQVLDRFKPTAEALRKSIVHEQETFNPHDSYWGSVNLSMNDAPTPRLTINELHEFTLGVLQNRRQEIMMQLQEEKNSALVEELTLLNSRIEMLEQENAGS